MIAVEVIMNFRTFIFPVMLISVVALAQEGTMAPKKIETSTISVQGDAQVQAKPDRAQIDVAVMTESPDSQKAASENAAKSEQVIQQLRSQIGQNLEIKTIGYSLNPKYVYPREGGEPKVTGYTALNTVQVQTDDLAQVGKIIDTAIKAGANQIQSLRFVLKDESEIQAQALREAAAKARKKADALASALGLKIVRILRVEESDGGPIPYQRTYAAEMAKTEAPTPIEPGTIEIAASISLTVEIQ
jgi:uncharacterized protein YggE